MRREMVTISRSDWIREVNNERGSEMRGRILAPYSRLKLTAQLGSWLEPLLALLAGSLYGVLLSSLSADLDSATTDKVLVLSVLLTTATGRVSWFLFAMGASMSGIAWARRVIDCGFGHAQLTEYMAIGMVINVILHFVIHPVSIPRQMKRLILFAFLPALAFALAASIGGWINGNPEYMRPMRACLTVVGVPYAFLNIRNSGRARRVFWGIVYLSVMSCIVRLPPLFAGTAEGLGPFLLAAPVIGILLLPKRAPMTRICGILAVLSYALTSVTLVVFLSVALTVALYFCYHVRARIIRRLMLFCLIVFALAVMFVGASVLSDELVLGPGATLMKLDSGWHREDIFSVPLDRIRYKAYDRLVLWIPAIREIVNAPFELNAGARSLMVHSLSGAGEKPWSIHVHNVFIEVMRQFSLPGSIFFNILVIAAFITLYRSLRQSKRHDPDLLAWSLFGLSFLPGFLFGFYPIAGEIGVYFWLACGVSYNLRLSTAEGRIHVN